MPQRFWPKHKTKGCALSAACLSADRQRQVDTVEKLRQALLEFKETYNRQ